MKLNTDKHRHDFILVRRYLQELSEGKPIERHRLKRVRDAFEGIVKGYFVEHTLKRTDYEFDYDRLLWRKVHFLK